MVQLKNPPPLEFLNEEIRCSYKIPIEMKKAWSVQLDLAQELFRVCNKHNLKIVANFGTLLGAVRHKGFIPWDDDMDFTMLRSDYEKLCSIAEMEFKYPYFFQFDNSGKSFVNGHAKLRNSETTGIVSDELNRNLNYNQGIFIDIFPLDNVYDNKVARYFQMKTAWLFRNLMLAFAYFSTRYFETRGFIRIPKKVFHFVVNKPFGLLQVITYKLMMKASLACKMKKTKMVSGLSFSDALKVVCRDDLNDVNLMDFEYVKIPGLQRYDNVLKVWFGDWKTPRQAAATHSGIIFDTEKSFKEYLEGAHSSRF